MCTDQGSGLKHLDTQSTAPLLGAETDDSPVPTIGLADLLELGKDELGCALFLDSLKLGPGACFFREFILNGLIDGEKILREDAAVKGLDKLRHVHNVTVELVKDAKAKAQAWDRFNAEGYLRVKASAEISVAKVKDLAAKDPDRNKAQKQLEKADIWLSKEVAALDKRKTELRLHARNAAVYAAGKVHALIRHLRSSELLSEEFHEAMEVWSQLDVTDEAARAARRAVPQPVELFNPAEASVPTQESLASAPEPPPSQESLGDSAPEQVLQDSGPCDSVPQESIGDSAEQVLQDSGREPPPTQESVGDSVEQVLRDSGREPPPTDESVGDSAPEQVLQDSGREPPRTQESVGDSAPEQVLQNSGPQLSVGDSAPEQVQQDSGPRELLPIPESQVMLPRAGTEGSLASASSEDPDAVLSPTHAQLRHLNTSQVLALIDEAFEFEQDVAGSVAGGVREAEIAVATQVHCTRLYA